MFDRRILMVALGVALVCGAASAARAEVKGAWVATDRTVDCSSYETIVRDVIKPGMTEEHKALALYDFYRQMVYHYRNMPESRNPVKCINVLGNTLCGSQATCMTALLERAGIKARVVAMPGHTFYEAFYDGKWHGFDTMMHFYVYTRGKGKDRNIASFEETARDPSLIKDAVKEGRAAEGICPCGDDPMFFTKKLRVLKYKPLTSDWSVKDYSLRDGEEIVRSWWPHGRPLPGTYGAGREPGPIHGCGSRDRKNPYATFRFFEPYGIRGMGGKTVSFRHYCNGWMNYSPDLSQAPLADALAAGELIVPVKCPYYISGTALAFEADCPGDADAVAVSVSVDGKKWVPVITAKDKGMTEYRTSLGSTVIRPSRGLHEYQLKFALTGAAALKRLHLKTIFTHNAMASPHLMPGRNKVTVAVDNAPALKARPVTVVYRYKDAPNWSGEVKTIERSVSASPFTFDVTLPETKKLPQMQDLTLRYGALHWVPAKKELPVKTVFDFSRPEAIAAWLQKAGPDTQLTHNGEGMLITVAKKATYPQVYCASPVKDWIEFNAVVIDVENLGPKPQAGVLRVQSNDTNKERSDVELTAPVGRSSLTADLALLKKTKLKAVTRVYLMTYKVSEDGCKICVKRIWLRPKKEL